MAANYLMKFHRYRFRDIFEVIILEPEVKKYIWLSFYLDSKLRNGRLSIEIIKYLLSRIEGEHHIHPPKLATTFKRAARQLRWRNDGVSRYFERCDAYQAKSKNYNTTIEPLLDCLLEYKVFNRTIDVRSFHSKAELKKAIKIIKEDLK